MNFTQNQKPQNYTRLQRKEFVHCQPDMPSRKVLTLLSLIAIITAQCNRYGYYMSPFNTVDHPYRAHLLNADSAKKATFINVALSGAGYNDDLTDGAWLLQSSLYKTHKFGSFRGWYGGTLGLGQYDIADLHGYNSFGNTDPEFINAHAGTKFMGGIGAFGGLSVVQKIDENAEWRALSVETSYLKEFGAYLNFRNKLSDTTADAYYQHNYFLTMALGSEFATKTKRGEFGFKVNYTIDLNRMAGYFIRNGTFYANPRLTSLNFAFHWAKYTRSYFMMMGGGPYSLNMQIGMNFRLGHL